MTETAESVEFVHRNCEPRRLRDVQAVIDQRDALVDRHAELRRAIEAWIRHGEAVPSDVTTYERWIVHTELRAILDDDATREPMHVHPDAEASNALAGFVIDHFESRGYVPFSARYGVAGDFLRWLDENRPGWRDAK